MSLNLLMSRRFRLTRAVAILMIFACSTALGQSRPSPQDSVVRVEGTVRSVVGQAIGGAVVVIQKEDGGPRIGETTTDATGNFTLSVDRGGTYIVHAERPGFRAADTQPLALVLGDKKHVDLILRSTGAADSASAGGSQGPGDPAAAPPKSGSVAGAMEFADTPNFTVAGVTDYSNAGLHGSDARVRTSEALNKDTLALKSPNAGGVPPADNESSPKNEKSTEEERKLRATLVQSPRSFEANHQLGEFCLRLERFREAIPPLEAASRIDPGNRANAFDLALAYEGSGDLARAREFALKIPINADTHRLLGDIDEKLGDPVAAVHEYEQAAHSDPSEQNYFNWGAELLLHKAALPAVEVFTNGSRAYPKSARIVAGLGAALYASGSYDDAAWRLCDASDLDPADLVPYLLLGKMEMAASGPVSCAEERLARFSRQQPANAQANYYYAMDLWKRMRASEKPGDLQQLQDLLEKAVGLDPKFGEAYVQLGILYSEQKKEQQAIASFNKAIAVSPELAVAHYRLSLAYKRVGEDEKAREEMHTYEQIEKTENAAMERERHELRQFLIILKEKPTASP